MKHYNNILLPFFVVFVFLLSSCQQKSKETKDFPTHKEMKKTLTNVNKTLLEAETEDIEGIMNRNGWKMDKTQLGVYYMIYHTTNKTSIKNGNLVNLEYELRLINYYLCYSSKKDGIKRFYVGKGQVEKGLDEVMTYLHYGDKAKIIIPSYLGYGLLGDHNEIPPKALLIYDIEVIDFTKQK